MKGMLEPASQELMLQFMDACLEPMALKDADSRFIYVNQSYRELLHLPDELDIRSLNVRQLPQEIAQFSELYLCQDQQIKKSKKSLSSLEINFFGKDRQLKSYLMRKTPLFNAQGELEYIVVQGEPIQHSLTIFSKVLFGGILKNEAFSIAGEEAKGISQISLSKNNWEAAFLFSLGLSYKSISQRLGISKNAAEMRIKRVSQQLDIPVPLLADHLRSHGWISNIPQRFLFDKPNSIPLDSAELDTLLREKAR
ncbi:PAS domain-containing protein [Dongshaea marina]|uniref:PAS domain-containing protein n=1 Tax=Dongshaea marina TaxID=2047966 RepID=UPI000D3E7A08|nr:PAS domain-containing protein [Dongshaea marina]